MWKVARGHDDAARELARSTQNNTARLQQTQRQKWKWNRSRSRPEEGDQRLKTADSTSIVGDDSWIGSRRRRGTDRHGQGENTIQPILAPELVV